MWPILIDVPALHLRVLSGHALILTAVLAVLWMAPRSAAALEGLDPRRVRSAAIVLAVVLLAGARLHFALNHWSLYAADPLALIVPWSGGFHIGGGLIALALAAPAVTRRRGLPLGRFGDGVAPAVAASLTIARIGCFLHGCCFGIVCEWPWCISFPRDSTVYRVQQDSWLLAPGAAHSAPVHPLQLYFAGAALGIAAFTWWLQRRKRYDGQAALAGLFLFSVSTVGFELLRAEYGASPHWGPFPQLVWTALAMTAASSGALIGAETVNRRRARAEDALAV